jgi:hypothetical protein
MSNYLARQLLVGLTMSLLASFAHAATYQLSLDNLITGSFEAVDYDQNGMIDADAGEVLDFSLSFSGDYSLSDGIPAFTLGHSDLHHFYWYVGSDYLGDEGDSPFEGEGEWLLVEDDYFAVFSFPGYGAGASVGYYPTGGGENWWYNYSEHIAVSAVPLPASLWLFLSGLIGFGAGHVRNIWFQMLFLVGVYSKK